MKLQGRILAIASGSGHWKELVRLADVFEGYEVTWATTEPGFAADVPGQRFRTVTEASRWDRWRLLRSALGILWLVLRERPRVVITTGAAPGYFGLFFAKKLLGAKTVWLDSFANGEQLSMSGQKAGRLADLWLTQWPDLARPEGPEYAGSVL